MRQHKVFQLEPFLQGEGRGARTSAVNSSCPLKGAVELRHVARAQTCELGKLCELGDPDFFAVEGEPITVDGGELLRLEEGGIFPALELLERVTKALQHAVVSLAAHHVELHHDTGTLSAVR